MTIKKLWDEFNNLAEMALTIDPYASGHNTYRASNPKNTASVTVYISQSTYRSVKFKDYGHTIEINYHSTPTIELRHGSFESKLLKKLHDDCKKVIVESVEGKKAEGEAEEERRKEARRAELEAELARLG